MVKQTNPYKYFVFLISLTIICRFGLLPAQDDSNDKNGIVILGGWGADIEVCMIPDKPFLGDEVEITCLVKTPYRNLPESKIVFILHKGAKLIGGKEVNIHPPMQKGETAEFSIRTKVVSRLFQVTVAAYARVAPEVDGRGREWEGFRGKTIDIVALAKNDTVSYEKFGNDLDIWSRIGPEYQYDIEAGARIPPMGRSYDKEAKKIRAQINALQKLDPTLSDWEALELMHNTVYDMVWRYGIHNQEEAIRILLEARKLMKEKGLSKWQAVDEIIDGTKEER